MFIISNPEIDYAVLEAEVAQEVQMARSLPPFTIEINGLAFNSANQAVLELLDEIEVLVTPRTALPARLNRFPFNSLAFFARLVLRLDNALFFRHRLALRQVSAALRLQVQVNKQLFDQLAALTRHLSIDK